MQRTQYIYLVKFVSSIKKNSHGGTEHVRNIVQQKIWVIGGRSVWHSKKSKSTNAKEVEYCLTAALNFAKKKQTIRSHFG